MNELETVKGVPFAATNASGRFLPRKKGGCPLHVAVAVSNRGHKSGL
jgi:hypothetical protein